MKKRTIISCLLAVCLVFWGATAALAQNLGMEITSDGVNATATEFSCGDDLYLHITLVGGTTVAGCAFTVEYNATFLTAPTTTSAGLAVVATDFSSSAFLFGDTDEITHRGNSFEAGKIYVSGAAINETNGGSAEINTDLFIIKFKVKYGITTPQTLNFTITQTELWNPLAGYGLNYGTPVTEDRAFGQAGDTKETVPVLVGAVNSTHADFNNLTAAFPVLLGDATHPFTPVTDSSSSVTFCAQFQMGDANGDGNVTFADVMRVFYHVNAVPNMTPMGNCDIDGLNGINMADVMRIFYHVNGIDQW